MTPQELEADGWKEYRDYLYPSRRLFAKRFDDTPTLCNHNQKLSVHVYLYASGGIEVDITAEMPNEDWVKFQVYGMPIPESIDRLNTHVIPRLLAAWEAAATYTP